VTEGVLLALPQRMIQAWSWLEELLSVIPGFRTGSARVTSGYGACKDAERDFERSFGYDGKDSCLPPDWIGSGPVAVLGHEETVAGSIR
jgi:hypothetical protein